MAFTRAKANTLLNTTEMGLYDDSRANAVRGHTGTQLTRLISRARTARDRARDLEKRQKLALRKQTGSKTGRTGQANARSGEKAELLADILKRFEAQHKDTVKHERADEKLAKASKTAAGKTTARKAATKKAASKSATKTSTARKSASKKAAGGAATKKAATGTSARKATKKVAKKTAPAKKAARSAVKSAVNAAAKKAVGRKAAKTTASASKTASARKAAPASSAVARSAKKTKKSAGISPRKALSNTRKLLEQHNAEARAPKPWQQIEEGGGATPAPGYQSDQAAHKAQELHAAESRMASIQGSISTRDRKNQGKRDHRNDE